MVFGGGASGFDLGTAHGRVIIDASGVGAAMSQAQGHFSSGLSAIGQSVQSLGSQMTSLGASIGILTAPVALFGQQSLAASIEFESAFAGVRKTVDATEEEFAELERRIIEMATSPDRLTSSIENADVQLARIMELAGQLGVSGVDNLSLFTETIALLGLTTNLTSEQGALALAQFANITQMPIENIDRLGSVIVDLGNNMATTEADIVEMGQRIAGAGNAARLTESEIMAFAAALSSVGINAEAGGTAISRVMLDINSAVETGGEGLETLARVSRVSAQDFAAQWRTNPAVALNRFIGGLRVANTEGQNMTAILEELGFSEIRTRDALLRLASGNDLVSEALGIANEAWEENNALQEEAERRAETTESGMNRLQNMFDELQRTIGDQLKPALDTFAETLIPILQNIITWVQQNPELVGQIALIAGALAGLAAVLVPVGIALSAIGAVLGVILSPIGLLIAGIAALGVAFVTNFGGIRDVVQPIIERLIGILQGAWATIQPSLQAIYNWFVTEALPRIRDFVETVVMPAVDRFIGVLADIWTRIQPGLQAFFDWVVTDGLPAITTLWDTVFRPAIETVIDILATIWEVVGPALADVFTWFMENGLPVIGDFINDVIIPIFQGVIDILTGIWNSVRPHLESLKGGMDNIFRFVRDSIIQPVIDLINRIPDAMRDAVSGMLDFIANNQFLFSLLPGGGTLIQQVQAAQAAGFQGGIAYVPHDMLANIHQGEAVLSPSEAERWRSGQGGGGDTIILQVPLEVLRDEPGLERNADTFARQFVEAKRRRG